MPFAKFNFLLSILNIISHGEENLMNYCLFSGMQKSSAINCWCNDFCYGKQKKNTNLNILNYFWLTVYLMFIVLLLSYNCFCFIMLWFILTNPEIDCIVVFMHDWPNKNVVLLLIRKQTLNLRAHFSSSLSVLQRTEINYSTMGIYLEKKKISYTQ